MAEWSLAIDNLDQGIGLLSLNGAFSRADISMALTTAGLLPEQTEVLVHLYAEEGTWDGVAQRWHEERQAGRGSRGSAQKILHLIQERLNAPGAKLPSLMQLASILKHESSAVARAQILYFYLVEADNLFRAIVHELLRDQGLERTGWDLSKDVIQQYLEAFRYEDGDHLEYAGSTLERWAQGFRSVLKHIGVRKTKYSDEGGAPTLRDSALAVAAGYSWKEAGDEWDSRPIGWIYLFQAFSTWSHLRERLASTPDWTVSERMGERTLRPEDDPFDATGIFQ